MDEWDIGVVKVVASCLARSCRIVVGEMDLSSSSDDGNIKVSHRRCEVSCGGA